MEGENLMLYFSVGALICAFLLILASRALVPRVRIKAVVGGLLAIHGSVFLAACFTIVLLFAGVPARAQEQVPAGEEQQISNQQGSSNMTAVGAALATGLAAIGAGIAVGLSGSAAIGGITEKPEVLGRSLIIVGLAEGIAIYGLIISFMLLGGT
jgi:V/A-type H+-transporting ATPase subunit K